MERAVILCKGKVVTVQDLPLCVRERPMSGEGFRLPLGRMTLAELEKQCILQALEQINYNRL